MDTGDTQSLSSTDAFCHGQSPRVRRGNIGIRQELGLDDHYKSSWDILEIAMKLCSPRLEESIPTGKSSDTMFSLYAEQSPA